MKEYAKNEIFEAGRPYLGIMNFIKPFLATVPILQPLKTSEAVGVLVLSGGIKWVHVNRKSSM